MRVPVDPDAKPWVIYLHGNDANVATRMNLLHYEKLRNLGLNVIAPEYRGFGGLEGVPSEAGVDSDARAAYDYLRRTLHADPRRIIIYGWSLGSAVAVDLASHVDEAAVVLEERRPRRRDRRRRYRTSDPAADPQPVRVDPQDRQDWVAGALPPQFADEIIPFEEGRRLFEAAPEPKQFVEVTGGHVYAAEKDPRFFRAIRWFLQEQRLLP
jgi:fermentation-respiration switch protein FrsA (DUF1100 family)